MNSLKRQEIKETLGIRYLLERKRITRMHIYVKPPDGEVLVTAPLIYSDSEIESFVRSRADWIRKHVKRFRERPDQGRLALKYETGETLYFWGVPYRIQVAEKAGSRSMMELSPEPEFNVTPEEIMKYRRPIDESSLDPGGTHKAEGKATLIVPCGSSLESREKAVRRKYKEILEKEAGWVLGYWCKETGLDVSSWHVRFMKTRWGSLSIRERRVSLSTRLAEKPEICLIYVALHEVCHVKEANHGPLFKALLTRYMPSWRIAEKILKA